MGNKEARPEWHLVPPSIIFQIEQLLQQKLISGEIVWGGYTNSACFKITLADGSQIFAKGTHPEQDAHGVKTAMQEIYAYQNIPVIKEIAPQYLGFASDGDEDGWLLALFEYIDAEKNILWDAPVVTKAFAALARMHNLKRSDLPYNFPEAKTLNYIERYFKAEGGWLRIRGEEKTSKKFLTIFTDENEGRIWLEKALPKLCALHEKVESLQGREGLLHMDLRVDNFLFGQDGKTRIIDFPNACFGNIAADVVYIISSIAAEGVLTPSEILKLYNEATGITPDEESLAIMLSSISGFVADLAYREKPKKAPRLPAMRKKLLKEMMIFAEDLLEIPPLPPIRLEDT